MLISWRMGFGVFRFFGTVSKNVLLSWSWLLVIAYRSMSSFMSRYMCMYMYTFLPMHVHVHIHIDNNTNSTIPTHWTDALSKKDKNQRKQ